MPAWVEVVLSRLVFSFFWSGKRELVSRSAVVQSHLFGGFSVVDVQSKVRALLGQWVRRFVSSPSSWVALMSFWFNSLFGVSPFVVFSRPFSFDPRVLPPFYQALVLAWRKLDGPFATSKNSLVYGSSCPLVCSPVLTMSAKSCNLYLLSENMIQPHCVLKFMFIYPNLDWPATWRALSFFHLDRRVIDLNWKIAHGVLYTARRLSSFGLSIPLSCFCGPRVESLEHLFFYCPLAQSVLAWVQSLLFCFSPMCPVITLRHVLFGFNSTDLVSVPRVFVYLLNVSKFCIWLCRNDFRLRDIRPSAVAVIASIKARLKSYLPVSFRRCKSNRRRRVFYRQWCARGVIASVHGDSLRFAF